MICFVPLCAHYTEKHTCKFYRFPKDEKLRSKWIKAIKREDTEPKDSSRVCSCHFPDQKKENGPSIFPWNEKKTFQFTSPVKKKPRFDLEDIQESIIVDKGSSPLGIDRSTQIISSIQNEAEITILFSENIKLKSEIAKLKHQPFGIFSIEHDESLVKYYTGITLYAFRIITELCCKMDFKYFFVWKPSNLSIADQILMTLMKLRLNLGFTDLGVRFHCSSHTVGNVVLTIIHLLHEILFEYAMKDIPPQSKNLLSLPDCFMNFRNCRMVIDCAEFYCQITKRLDEQKDAYSNYKHSDTVKALIGVVPNGTITYASKLYPGSTSDKMIVKHSGIVNYFKAGDLILTDEGFLLHDVVPQNVSVNIPPFLPSPQFTPEEVQKTKSIARAKIHVERAIRRLKLYRILHFIPKSWYEYSSTVFQLCVALTNLENPLISEVANSKKSFLEPTGHVQQADVISDSELCDDDL